MNTVSTVENARPRIRTSPAPEHARRLLRTARWVLTSGFLAVDDNGLRLDPDRLWAAVFRPDGGWYIARWPDVAHIELRRGGRYSLLRGQLSIFDHAGERVFRGEVDWRNAKSLLIHAVPEYANLQAERMRGRLSVWRFEPA